MTLEQHFTTLILIVQEHKELQETGEKEQMDVKFEEEAKETEQEKRLTPKRVIREILSWIIVLVTAFGLAYFITNYVIVKAVVPTGSMESTIMTDDKIIGNRIAYLFSEPKRGDIIIFKYPDDETENYVKRIIGLPGDKVEIIQGKVYINDSAEPLEEPYLNEGPNPQDYYGPYLVPEGCYFVMGDNRNQSLDARFWVNTYVAKEKIIGKVWFRYSPSIGKIK